MKYGRKNTMKIVVTGIYILSAFIGKSYGKTLERTVLLSYAADTEYMKRSIKRYFSKVRHHTTSLETKKEAKEYIHDEFQRLGLTTKDHSFWNNMDRDKKIQFTNVIGWIKGEKFGQADDHVIGVGAHYDTAESSPGVDDNGSGLAAMLEVATQVSEAVRGGTKITNTIIFVAFDAGVYNEHMGGFYFVRDWFNPWLKSSYPGKIVDTRGFIIMDAVMVYNNKENSQTFPEGEMPLSSWAALGRSEFKLQSFPLEGLVPRDFLEKAPTKYFMESEHRSMWLGGIPAIYVTDSGKLRGEMINCFHKPCDNIETILTEDNLKFLGKIADVVAKTVLGANWQPVTKNPGPGGHTGSRPSSGSMSSVTSGNHILPLSLSVVYQVLRHV